jgi:hypothetical protein
MAIGRREMLSPRPWRATDETTPLSGLSEVSTCCSPASERFVAPRARAVEDGRPDNQPTALMNTVVSRRMADAIGMTRKKGGIRTWGGYCHDPSEPVSPMHIIGATAGAR